MDYLMTPRVQGGTGYCIGLHNCGCVHVCDRALEYMDSHGTYVHLDAHVFLLMCVLVCMFHGPRLYCLSTVNKVSSCTCIQPHSRFVTLGPLCYKKIINNWVV